VPLQGTLSQNIVTYEVPVSLEGTEGVTLKAGMTANLKITVGKKENVLLVPAMAVQYDEGLPTVLVQDNSNASPAATNVEVGLSDGTYTEIVRGLNEGDLVVIVFTPTEEGGFSAGPGFIGIPGAGQRREGSRQP
jgi:multidrug efflux pump subunit AcrA (membrane-fusion protein)